MKLFSSDCRAYPLLSPYSAKCVALAMATMAELALLKFVGGGSRRSVHVTVTLENNFFQMLCRRNKKPSKTTVQRWWDVLKQPMDDTNAASILNLVRRALLDWPKMGAAIAQMAHEELVLARNDKKLRKKVAAKVAKKLDKQRARDAVHGIEPGSARTNNPNQKCVDKLPRRTVKVVQK
jgi:hypothetical protein